MLSELSNETYNVSLEDCIRLNVSGMALSIYVGGEYEHQTLVAFSELIDAGYDAGIPILAVTAVGREMARDARYLSLSSRIAAEMGANIVKTYYCENFERVTGTCPSSHRHGRGEETSGDGGPYHGLQRGLQGRGRRGYGAQHFSVRLPRCNDQGRTCRGPP